jgi:TPR repeat protein/transglutaminase-like putative cysteine protease
MDAFWQAGIGLTNLLGAAPAIAETGAPSRGSRIGFAALLLCAAMISSPAQAGDQPAYGPPETWVKPLAVPTGGVAPDGAPAQVLLYEVQAKLGADSDSYFVDRANKILTPEGLATVGTVTETWDPDTEDLTIHYVHVIRGDTVIDALAGGQKLLVLRRENKLELAMLDGRLTATFEPEGLQVGDVVDFSYTLTRHDPALKGNSQDFDALEHVGVAKRVYWREFWPVSKTMRWRATEGLPAPTVAKTADGTELIFDMHDVETPKPPLGAPARFLELGGVELSQFADWAQLSGLLAPLYDKATTLAPNSPLHAEVAKIAAASADPKARTTAALRLVEDETRYVFLGMNDGGLVPADADQTWARRFGDCKGKTALLVALLRALGVDAEPVLVNTVFGDGMDERLPMASWFDHAIVRAEIGGKTYWLDGTRIGDRNIDDLTIPPYGWALPVRTSGATLIKLTPQPLTQPSFEVEFKVDASKGPDFPAPTHIDSIYRGENAVKLRQTLASVDKSDNDRYLRDFWTKADPWLDVDTVGEFDDPVTGLPHLTADGMARLNWETTPDGARFLRVPNTSMGANVTFKRQPGLDQDAPYSVAFPLFNSQTWRITLPAGGSFELIGADVDETLAGSQWHRTSRVEGGVLIVEATLNAIEPEFPASEAEADGAALRAMALTGVSVAYRPGFKPVDSGLARNSAADQAAAGDAAAQFRLGRIYANGYGVPLDWSAAVTWFRKSAEQGYADGEAALGTAMLTGQGVTEDDTQGLVWLRKAADQNNAMAAVELGYVYLTGKGAARDLAQSVEWDRKAAEQGNSRGELALGTMYLFGQGAPRDLGQALAWIQKAADQGLPRAEAQLAGLYLAGIGIPKDVVRGLALERKAAAENDAQAERVLGFIYLNGQGVPSDRAQALAWFDKASAQGDEIAKRQDQILRGSGDAVAPPPVILHGLGGATAPPLVTALPPLFPATGTPSK